MAVLLLILVRFLGKADDKAYQAYYCQRNPSVSTGNCSAHFGENWFHGAAGYEDWVWILCKK